MKHSVKELYNDEKQKERDKIMAKYSHLCYPHHQKRATLDDGGTGTLGQN
jgi:hypothetical protein